MFSYIQKYKVKIIISINKMKRAVSLGQYLYDKKTRYGFDQNMLKKINSQYTKLWYLNICNFKNWSWFIFIFIRIGKIFNGNPAPIFNR